MANEALLTELASYMLAVPILISYMVYRKRKILRTVAAIRKTSGQRFLDEIAGVVLCFLALTLYLYGSYTFYTLELHLISLPIFIAGCILIIFNWETLRALTFPTSMLLLLAIPPLEIAFLAGAMLGNASSQIAYTLLKFLGLPVELDYLQFAPIIVLYSVSGVPLEFAVQVASSGIYSLLGFTVFAVFAAYIIRGAFWKKIIVLLLGFSLIFALNIVRVTSILMIGYWFGPGVTMELFHIFGGWVLIFISAFILLFFGEKMLKIRIFTSKTNPVSCVNCGENLQDDQGFCFRCGKLLRFPRIKLSGREILKIVALILSAVLVTYIQVPIFAVTQGPAELILQTSYGYKTSKILPKIENYTLVFMYRDRSFEQMYGQDTSLVYAYTSRGSYPIIWVALEISKARSPLHNWEICYYTQEQRGALVRLDLREVQLLQNPQVTARFYSFQVVKRGNRLVEGNFTETILYWFTKAAFDTEKGVEWRYVKISVWVDTWDADYREVEKKLLIFGEAIANYWEPIKSWSGMAIAIGEHRFILFGTAISLLLFIMISNLIKKWKGQALNLKLYRRLSYDEKLIFQAVLVASNEGISTTNAITLAYQKLSSKSIEQSELLEKLKYANEADLIKEYIVNHDDNPVLAWKLTFKIKD